MGDPELVVLDEPMTGLDPLGRKEIRDLILELKQEGRTVFYSTHILPDVEMTCDRVAMVFAGHTRSVGPSERSCCRPACLTTEIVVQAGAAGLPDAPPGTRVRQTPEGAAFELGADADVDAVLEGRRWPPARASWRSRPDASRWRICSSGRRRDRRHQGESRVRRIWAITRNTFREAVRNKILYSLLFFAVLIILSAVAVGRLSVHEELRMTRDIGLFGIDVFGVIIAIFVGVNLLYKELDLKTVYTILPKPIHRWEFVLGKWLGMLLTLAVQVAVMGVVLAVTLALQGGAFDLPLWKALWLLYVNVVVVTSVAVLFSSFSSPFLSGFFSLGVFIVGRSVPDIQMLAEKMEGPARGLLAAAVRVLPNLHLFYPSGAIVGAETVSVHGNFVGVPYLGWTTAYGFGYSVVVLLLAMFIFRRRDFV